MLFTFVDLQADSYVEYCIAHQGRGTLFSVLQSRDLCTSVDFQYHSIAGIALGRILCMITDASRQQIDTIINLIFQVEFEYGIVFKLRNADHVR